MSAANMIGCPDWMIVSYVTGSASPLVTGRILARAVEAEINVPFHVGGLEFVASPALRGVEIRTGETGRLIARKIALRASRRQP